ncbi:branched-chain amino acid ABC transporter permease [Nocardioides carbamazepini]|uniref:branched-chain amino acid ABC transporter permease n=1 Tax=Nocardioides carbamazepini TaxID=2854259 RepID=UPI00214A696A|nr:branched-chain amino acid ABC transporter permease [Nocardioides carbamazepini]MCR1783795.1 branched-chain amino acid ABC transporter permease [Nocardioides carbamazepini]
MRSSEWLVPVGVTAAAVVIGLVTGLGDGVGALVVPWICIHALLAMAMRLVMQVGEINLAVGAFYGIGAYTAAQMNLLLEAPLLVSVVAGGLLAGAAALVFGGLVLRVSGAAFILVSFAANEVLRLTLTKTEWVGGNSGLVGVFADPRAVVTAMVIVTGVVALLLVMLERSRWGRQFAVVENKPLLASCAGINPRSVKLIALVASGVICGVAGGLFAHYSSVVAPPDFSYMISISVLAFVMIGGRDHLLGAVVGAAVLTYLTEEMRMFGAYEPVIYGGALMIAMVLMPKGLVGAAHDVLRRVTDSRRGSSSDPTGEPSPAPREKERAS